MQPIIGQPEEDEGASDFEPGEDDEEDDEDFEDEEDDVVEVAREPEAIRQGGRKRTRDEAGESEQRPAKH